MLLEILQGLVDGEFHARADMRELVTTSRDPDERDELVLHQLSVARLALGR